MSIVSSSQLLSRFYRNNPEIMGRFGRGGASRAKKVSTGETAARNIKTEISNLQDQRNALKPIKARHVGAVGNTENRLRAELGRSATMRVAQADRTAPTSFRGALDQATRRMRARQGIVNRGDKAIRNQALSDRIKIAQQQESRRGSLQNSLQQAVNIREGVNVGLSNANARIRSARANMWGTLAGSAVRGLQQWNNNRAGSVSQSVDQGQAAADYINANPPVFHGDIDTPLPTMNG